MEKYAKHLILTIGGGCLTIAGTILWQIVASLVNWSRVEQYGLAHEIGLASMWPFAIIGGIMGIIGLFFIAGSLINLLTRE